MTDETQIHIPLTELSTTLGISRNNLSRRLEKDRVSITKAPVMKRRDDQVGAVAEVFELLMGLAVTPTGCQE
jgi:hypothetical protein